MARFTEAQLVYIIAWEDTDKGQAAINSRTDTKARGQKLIDVPFNNQF